MARKRKKSKASKKKKPSRNEKLKAFKVLDVGKGNTGGLGQHFYPGTDITTLDAVAANEPDIVVDLESDDFLALDIGPFDAIVFSHVLEHIAPRIVPQVVGKLFEVCKPGAEIIVKVPSLEWAAEMLTSEKAPLAVLFHVYGGQGDKYDVHKWGYTLMSVRNVISQAGFIIAKAGRGRYEIVVSGQSTAAEENYVVGVKPPPQEDTHEGSNSST